MAAQHEVQPLFAEPLFRTNIAEAISDKQIEHLQGLKMVPNKTNFISEDLYIFEHPELKSMKRAVEAALRTYAQEVMGIAQTLYVTQSWTLTNPPNAGMHGHSHSNSIVSGSLYYCELPEPPASMVFDRHNTYQQLQLTPKPDRRNIFNTPINVVTPKRGDVVLFSSSLQHFVEPNQSKADRHSIAFNSFVKGKLGDYRDVCELKL